MIEKFPDKSFNLPPGIYRVKTVSGRYSKESKQIVMFVQVLEGPQIPNVPTKLTFRVPNTQFLFNKIALAAGKDCRKAPVYIDGPNGILGGESFMCVRVYVELTDEGEVLKETTEVFDFMQVGSPYFPAMVGDPKHDNGAATHQFRKEMVFPNKKRQVRHHYQMPAPLNYAVE